MKDETKEWLNYADENLKSAKILLESGIYNPTLQNVQQAVEKMLKALCVEFSLKFKKTHSINELEAILAKMALKSAYLQKTVTCSIQSTCLQNTRSPASCPISNQMRISAGSA